ncbi:hypothetical protein [Roseivirga sp.]|uniref:hypothetical protein n=1 Tax=Roseivirga sp. TaxID=1964215 RepID=UPI003B8CB4F2
MKIITTIATLILITQLTIAQEGNDYARVSKVNGIPVYIFNEPLNDYDVVASRGTGGKAGSLLTGGLVNEGISGKVSQYVKRLTKLSKKKKGFEFDAILYSSGKQAIAIKFKEDLDPAKKDLARVKNINGTLVFALCEPIVEYDLVVEKSGGAKVGSYLSGGLANKGIEGDLTQFARRIKKAAEEEGNTIDAILYNAGKRAIGIKFN